MKLATRITASLIGAALVGAALSGCTTNPQTLTCTVTEKDRSTNKDNQSVFRVYTEQCDTLGLADNIFAGNFNSADMFGKIKVGKTYEFQTVGTRNGFMSWFPEITKMREVA